MYKFSIEIAYKKVVGIEWVELFEENDGEWGLWFQIEYICWYVWEGYSVKFKCE